MKRFFFFFSTEKFTEFSSSHKAHVSAFQVLTFNPLFIISVFKKKKKRILLGWLQQNGQKLSRIYHKSSMKCVTTDLIQNIRFYFQDSIWIQHRNILPPPQEWPHKQCLTRKSLRPHVFLSLLRGFRKGGGGDDDQTVVATKLISFFSLSSLGPKYNGIPRCWWLLLTSSNDLLQGFLLLQRFPPFLSL